jgi:F-type H+-transporting ATPase subunit b
MKTIRDIFKIAVLSSIAVLATVSVAAAVAGGGGETGPADPMDFVWKIVNFSILVFVLVKFGRKPIAGFLKARTEGIKKSLDEAREAKELAQQALDEVKEKLKNKDREMEEIISSAKASGEKERERIIEEAGRMSEKLIEQTRANIDFELKQAREAIKAEAAEIAMELAEKKIKEKLTEEDRKRLFEEALGKLEGRN